MAKGQEYAERVIHETTKIPLMALRGGPLTNFSVEERMR